MVDAAKAGVVAALLPSQVLRAPRPIDARTFHLCITDDRDTIVR
jgi:hypothetical protein